MHTEQMGTSTPRGDNGAKEPVAAVVKAFRILSVLADEGELGVSEIAMRLATSKSSAHRLLQTLQDLEVVDQNPETSTYFLTLKLTALGSKIAAGMDISSIASPYMRRINDETGETVHLGILDGMHIVYIQKFDSKYTLRLYSQVGKRAPAHCTAIGKVLLAWKDPAERKALLDAAPLACFTPNTITSPEAFEQVLAQVREQGFAEDNEEHEPNIRCIAVPLFDYSGRVAAGLSLSLPSFRFEEINKAAYVALLKDAGRKISQRLGASG